MIYIIAVDGKYINDNQKNKYTHKYSDLDMTSTSILKNTIEQSVYL